MTNSVTHRRALRQSAKPDKFRVSGGARRDRTDDLKLAKLPLSQLSYGPILSGSRAIGRGGRSALRTFGPTRLAKLGGPAYGISNVLQLCC